MFDEPSSYLDVRQRLQAARVIRSLLTPDCYVIAVEHDLSVLDYLSDFVCCLYGKPSVYGVVTMPYSVREGEPNSNTVVCITPLMLLLRDQHILGWFHPNGKPAIPTGFTIV
jgi:ABC-type cobalamin/Fe3+-siderophores transport system ATPase subunit